MDLADKLKMALDEGRLLILGAQVIFGCQFQMVFQERFQDAPRESQAVQGIGLLALMLAAGARARGGMVSADAAAADRVEWRSAPLARSAAGARSGAAPRF